MSSPAGPDAAGVGVLSQEAWRLRRPIRARVARFFLVPPLILGGCDSGPGVADSLERARAGALRVGFAIERPYAFVDSAGAATGEAPVILRHMADALGVHRLQWFPLGFRDLIPALRAGRIDVIAAGLMVTSERRGLVRFSRPTACVAPVLISGPRISEDAGAAANGAGDGGTAIAAARAEDRVAVLEGSVEQRALEQRPAPGRVVLSMPDLATAVAALKAGNVDALAISAPTGRDMVRGEPGLAIREGRLSAALEGAGGCTAFAFRPADAALAAAFDTALAEFVGSPEHRRAVAPFGFTDAEVLTADTIRDPLNFARAKD